MGPEEVMEAYEAQYSDLKLLSSHKPPPPPSSSEEAERLESILTSIMENLGPNGPGLIAVTGVPNTSTLRKTLLPLARKLSLLDNEERRRILKEHSLGSDVPLKNLDRIVSSYAMQLKYEQGLESMCQLEVDNLDDRKEILELEKSGDVEFDHLGCAFKQLGHSMLEIGLLLARICDQVIGGKELQNSLLESRTAKGRLIHYHSVIDNLVIREASKRKASSGNKSTLKGTTNKLSSSKGHKTKICHDKSNLWQQWHYDYGIFTVLTSPMFLLSSHPKLECEDASYSSTPCEQQCASPCGHTYLEIYHPTKDRVLRVKSPPESFIVQVGESADVLSKGKLRATLHCVCRPTKMESLSRETFVVFLQPSWEKVFSLEGYPISHTSTGTLGEHESALFSKQIQKFKDSSREFRNVVPPLSFRLKDGMTFAEFSRETTRQYYGGNGLQSKR